MSCECKEYTDAANKMVAEMKSRLADTEAKLKEAEAKLAEKCQCSFCCGLDCGSKEHFESYESLKSKLSQTQAKVEELEFSLRLSEKQKSQCEARIVKLRQGLEDIASGFGGTLDDHEQTVDDMRGHAIFALSEPKEPEVISKIRDAFDVSFLKSSYRENLAKQLWGLTNKTDWENWRASTLAVPYYAITDFIIQKQEFMKGKVDNILRHFKAEHLLGHGAVSPMGCTGCDLIKSMEENNK